MAGVLITFDGLDGCGKSTQARLLAEWLRSLGRQVTECRDPGGTPLGDQLRAMVLGKQYEMTAATEAFLFMASRAELVQQIIRPSMAAGHVVLCDRFLLATIVYQGHAGGMDVPTLWTMGELATGGLMPSLTLVFDLPVDIAERRRVGEPDRLESRERLFHEKVRAGFLQEARNRAGEILVIDATASSEKIHQQVREAVRPIVFGTANK